jgi:hypothetical protein
MLGIAVSSVGSLVLPPDAWSAAYAGLPFETSDLQPFLRDDETEKDVIGYVARARAGFDALRKELVAYAPDAIVLVGSLRGEWPAHVSTFSLLTATDGQNSAAESGGAEYQPRERNFASFLLDSLVAAGFDLAWQEAPASYPPESIAVATEALISGMPVAVVPILINASSPPLPSAERCWDLGVALRKVLARRNEKVAILASGGLSYDMLGRWVDEPFDRWFLGAIEAADMSGLKKLFKVQTEAVLGRTGEVRSWITAAAACGGAATVIDYFPARQAKSGIGFALWRGAPD